MYFPETYDTFNTYGTTSVRPLSASRYHAGAKELSVLFRIDEMKFAACSRAREHWYLRQEERYTSTCSNISHCYLLIF